MATKATGDTPITFILNDETVVNIYGFRVKNAALDLERFEANPVMLAHHVDGISTVCGRWENIRTEGTQLKADAIFDMEDKDAAKIAGKVNRGFLKGCSLGFMAYGFVTAPDGIPDLESGEVLEASVCPIPGNAGALKLYAPNGTVLSASEVKLSLDTLSTGSPKIDTPKNPMNKIVLSMVALTALGFTNFLKDGDEASFALAVEKLAKEHQELAAFKLAAEKEVAELKAKVQTLSGTQGKAIVDAAITAGKITEADREEFEALAASNVELCAKQLDRIPGKQTLGANGVKTPGGNASTDPKTRDEFQKLALPEQLAFKNGNPDAYKALFAKK